jgi:hypothetical protein
MAMDLKTDHYVYFHILAGDDVHGNGTQITPFRTYDRALNYLLTNYGRDSMSDATATGDTYSILGGGIGCATWSFIRFCSSAGDNLNDGLTPDKPKYGFIDLWNDIGVLADDYSLVILVNGEYSFNSEHTLIGGGRRSSLYCGTNKMIRGYTGTEYFGDGKCIINANTTTLFYLNSCNNAIFKNLQIYGSIDNLALITAVSAVSYNIVFEDCNFENVAGTVIKLNNTANMYYTLIHRCKFIGRSKSNGTAIISYMYSHISDCLIDHFNVGINTLNSSQGLTIDNTIITNCQDGIYLIYTGLKFSRLIIYGCDVAILGYGYSMSSRSVLFSNSIFANNGLVFDIDYGCLTAQYCCFLANPILRLNTTIGDTGLDISCIGSGCIAADPLFIDAPNGDFRLQAGSPCWNMGLSNPFIAGNTANIGCQQLDPVTPSVNDVKSGVQFGRYGTEKTGNVVLPDISKVLTNTLFDSLSSKSGTVSLPSVNDVRITKTFGASNGLTGVLSLPQTSHVRSGDTFGANSTEYTGTDVLPTVDSVIDNVGYGGNGTEFEGNYVTVDVNSVKEGLTFGSNLKLTGTYKGPAPASDTSDITLSAYSNSDTASLTADTIGTRLLANILSDINDLKDSNFTPYFRQVIPYIAGDENPKIIPNAIIICPISITDVSGSETNNSRYVDYSYKVGLVVKYAYETDAVKARFFTVNKLTSLFNPNKIYTNLPEGQHFQTLIKISEMELTDKLDGGINVYDTGLTITCRISQNY